MLISSFSQTITFTHDPKYRGSGICLFVVTNTVDQEIFAFVYFVFVCLFVVTIIFGLQRLTGVGCRMLS